MIPSMKTVCPSALRLPLALLAAGLLSACNLAPIYQRPDAPVPATLDGAASAVPDEFAVEPVSASEWRMLPWQQWVEDARLRQLMEAALQNNRDLRVAIANIEKARAQYGVQRADQLPTLNASSQASRTRTADDLRSASAGSSTANQFNVQLGLASYELDFWGRVRNLSESALQQYLQIEENRRSVQLGLITDISNAWITLASDQQRLQLARDTLATREHGYRLVQRMHQLGATNGLVLAQNQTAVETARNDVAAYESQVQRDRNALQLLVGGPVSADMLPQAPAASLTALDLKKADSGQLLNGATPKVTMQTATTAMTQVPARLSSTVLLARPDIAAAEHSLQAQYASIGAARAAFFPTISLTANVGTGSNELSGLFEGGNRAWSFVPQIRLPIFDNGRNQANLDIAQANRDVALAQYEKAIQTAFREVNDALADRATMQRRLDSQTALVASASRVLELSQARFKAGADDFLTVLDAQRSLYAAQQTQITLLQAEQVNRIALYKALGGGIEPVQ
ncbi:efflux transporter outer membrane subunit [Comamonas odontotermitis]|nr:efflux transporter outer membrane subunit [Comamonas odontotermitis]